MKYRLLNNKFIFNKNGTYFELTREEVVEMKGLFQEILNEREVYRSKFETDSESP